MIRSYRSHTSYGSYTPIQEGSRLAYKIVAFGEILWDLLPQGRTLGGAPFNFAYRVNSLGDVAYPVSRLGRDELGDEAWNLVESFGIDTSCLQRDGSSPTGTVQVFFDAENSPDYYIVPAVAYDFIESTPGLEQVVSTADCLCFGTLIQRSETSRRTLRRLLAKAGSALKLLDINLRKDCYTPETVRQSLEAADVVKLNEKEAPLVAEMMQLPVRSLPELAPELVRRWALDSVVITLGEKGAFAASSKGALVYVPGFRVQVVDTLGSGDAFSAGFIHRLLRGSSLREACLLGNSLGALAATRRGGTAVVSNEEIRRFGEQGQAERIVDPDLVRFAQE